MVFVFVSGQVLQTMGSHWSVLSDSIALSSIGSVPIVFIGDREIGGDREFVRNVPEVDDRIRPSSGVGEHWRRRSDK